VHTPELLTGVMEIILRHLESLDRSRRGNPTTSDRLNHRQRFKSVRGIAQALMGLMKPLALLRRELLWLASGLHVSPSELPVPVDLNRSPPDVETEQEVVADLPT
jgi:hypothetical protein